MSRLAKLPLIKSISLTFGPEGSSYFSKSNVMSRANLSNFSMYENANPSGRPIHIASPTFDFAPMSIANNTSSINFSSCKESILSYYQMTLAKLGTNFKSLKDLENDEKYIGARRSLDLLICTNPIFVNNIIHAINSFEGQYFKIKERSEIFSVESFDNKLMLLKIADNWFDSPQLMYVLLALIKLSPIYLKSENILENFTRWIKEPFDPRMSHSSQLDQVKGAKSFYEDILNFGYEQSFRKGLETSKAWALGRGNFAGSYAGPFTLCARYSSISSSIRSFPQDVIKFIKDTQVKDRAQDFITHYASLNDKMINKYFFAKELNAEKGWVLDEELIKATAAAVKPTIEIYEEHMKKFNLEEPK